MSDAASNYLENKLLDHTLRYSAAPYTGVNTVYCALFSGTAATVKTALESGTSATTLGNWGYYEITSASGYERTGVNFAAASGGSATTSGDVTFPSAGANYNNTANSGSTVTCIAVVDSGTLGAGNVMFYGQLDNPKEILNGDTFQVATGNLTVSLA